MNLETDRHVSNLTGFGVALLLLLPTSPAASASPEGQSVEYHISIKTKSGDQYSTAFEGNVRIAAVRGPNGLVWHEVWDSVRDVVVALPESPSPAIVVVQRRGMPATTVDLKQMAALSGVSVGEIVPGLQLAIGTEGPWSKQKPLRTENVTVWGREIPASVYEGSRNGTTWTILRSDEIPITRLVRHRVVTREDRGAQREFDAEVRSWRTDGVVSRISWPAGPTGSANE